MAFVASLSAAYAGDSIVVVNEGEWTQVYDIARISVQDNQIFISNQTDAELEVGINDIAPRLRVRKGLFIPPKSIQTTHIRDSKKLILRFVTNEGKIIRVTISIVMSVATEFGCYFFWYCFPHISEYTLTSTKTKLYALHNTRSLFISIWK